MNAPGRCWRNGGEGFAYDCDASNGTAKQDHTCQTPGGLYDMHGNVSEWRRERWTPKTGSAEHHAQMADFAQTADPAQSESTRKVLRVFDTRPLRGGAWDSNAINCRAAARFNNKAPACFHSAIGFRIAMETTETPRNTAP